MMYYLRQSTASQEVLLGPFVDSTDGNTEETGLTIANTDIEIYKCGSTTHADKNSGGATHQAKGMYSIVLDATDTDTIGSGRICVHVSGALYVTCPFTVLDEAVYDVIFGTTAPSTLAAGALMGLADDAITAAKLASDAGTEIASAVTTALGTGSGLTTLATAAELAKVPKSDSTVSWNATALAAINAEVDTALNTAIPGSPVADSINERVATMDGLVTSARMGALTDLIDGGRLDLLIDAIKAKTDALTLAAIADGVWDEVMSGHLSGGTAGAAIDDMPYNVWEDAYSYHTGAATIGKLIQNIASYIDTEVAAIKASTDPLTLAAIADAVWDEVLTSVHVVADSGAEMLATIINDVYTVDGVADAIKAKTDLLTLAAIADGVWDEALSGHSTAGTSGYALANVSAGASPADIADAVLDEWVSDHTDAGSLSKIIDTINTAAAAIKTVTDHLATAMEADSAVYRFTTNALEQGPVSSLTADAIANAVLDEWVSDHTDAGSLSKIIDTINTAAAAIKVVTDKIAGMLETDGAVSRYTANALEQGPTGSLTAAAVADAVLDEWPSDHSSSGSLGLSVTNIISALSTIAGYIDTEVAAIKAKTDNLPAAPAATGDIPSAATVAGAVRTELGTELARVDAAISTRAPESGGNIATLISRLTAARAGNLDEVTAARMATLTDWINGGRLDLILDALGTAIAALPTVEGIVDGTLDEVVEGSLTLRQIQRILLAVLAGKVSGAPVGPIAFRDVADAKNRVAATVDSSGNRTGITLDGA